MILRQWAWLLCVLALVAGCAGSPPPKPEIRVPGDYAYTKDYIRWFVQQQMKKHDVTGLSLALVDDQHIVWAEGFGYADKAHNVLATPETLYRAGSITKLFTATAIMQLVERGLIDLDRPITTYLPEFSVKSRFPDAAPITIRHILTHHSGLPRDVPLGMWSNNPQPYATVLDDLRSRYVLHPPNHIFSYSNLGMTVLGKVIERLSGVPYATYVSRSIFEPVGMTTASIETGVAASPQMAHAYNKGKEEPELPLRDIPAGGLNVSVIDLARFAGLVFAQGQSGNHRVVKPETFMTMLTPQNHDVPLDLDRKMGLGWLLSGVGELQRHNVGTVASHGGGTFHFMSQLVTLPDHKLGAVVMSNSSTSAEIVGKIAAKLLVSALEAKSGILSEEAPPADLPLIPLSPDQLADFEGWYNTAGGVAKVAKSGGKLYAEVMGKTFHLVPRPRQELGLEYKWLGLFPVDLGGLGDMTFSRATIEGHDLLIGRTTHQFRMVLGERIRPVSTPSSWLRRAGSYDIIDAGKDDALIDRVRLSIQDNFLVMTGRFTKPTPFEFTHALEPLSDTEAIVMGLGYGDGETVEVLQEAEQEILHYSGYRLKRTSTE
ncbi:MAG: beta-lactamase family protein [Nitrospira sp.]|nr:beta-lactamase family protein [Nitrospira sp.]